MPPFPKRARTQPGRHSLLAMFVVGRSLALQARAATLKENEHDGPVVIDDVTIKPQGTVEVAGERQTPPHVAHEELNLPVCIIPRITFTVHSLVVRDPGVEYTLALNEDFSQIYSNYAEKVDRTTDEITIRNVHGIIRLSDTPIRAAVRTGSILFVRGQNEEDNMDVHTTLVYLREVRTRPRRKTVIVHVDEQMDVLFKTWADEIEVEPDHITMIHENLLVKPTMTVSGVGLRNGDEVFCWTNI